jgi:CubicO group peptidase (beta-lactamase class C family)
MGNQTPSNRHATEEYFPPPEAQDGWRSLVPANREPSPDQKDAVRATAGLDWDRLHEVWGYCQSFGGAHSVLVIRRGWIAYEWHNYTEPGGIASCTKSLTGLAMAKLFDLSDAGLLPKRVHIDDEAWRYLPASWAEGEPARKQIRLRHMLTMTSGLTPHNGPFTGDYLSTILALKMEAAPGTVWAYASAPVDMLSLVIEDATGQTLGEFFNAEINARVSAVPSRWGRFAEHSGGSGGPEGGTRFTPRELARIGYLVLHGGAWGSGGDATQVISRERVTEFTQAVSWLEATTWRQPNFGFQPDANRYYGHLWRSNRTGQALGSGAPRDAVHMSGAGKQACFIVPSLDMVVVRLGSNRPLDNQPEFYHGLWSHLMPALTD